MGNALRTWLLLALTLVLAVPAAAQVAPAEGPRNGDARGSNGEPAGRITGTVIDEFNAISLPGVPVEVVGLNRVVYTDLDGKYVLDLAPGTYEIKVEFPGYQPKTIRVEVTNGAVREVNITLGLARFSEDVTVTAQAVTAETATVAAQLFERKRSGVVSDTLGAGEMKANADRDAASGLQRVTGLSLVDSQYVFVRGLGERYSNTTVSGATIPSTEPERRVVSLDIFPSGLLDSVSVVKSYTPDRPADFAGGLVEVVPTKIPTRPVLDFAYTFGGNTQSFGKSLMDHPAGNWDWAGIDAGSRALPGDFPDRRVIRGGIYTPQLGVSRPELERLGEALPNIWEPRPADGKPQQGFSVVFGQRWGKLGVLASVNESYKNSFQTEAQNYYRVEGDRLTTFSDYEYVEAANKGALATVANVAYQFTPNHRVGFQSLATNTSRRETRTFQGFNSDTGRNLKNARLLFRAEHLITSQLTGEHFFPNLANSRVDWRASIGSTGRDEPDIRETLYEEIGGRYRLADESQSGLRMFNRLDETLVDASLDWSLFFTNWRGLPSMAKFGPQYSTRQRDFASRRFRFQPINTRGVDLTLPPERLFTPQSIGPNFELREETRATDFYEGEMTLGSFYGMVDLPLAVRWRLVGGVRVENFTQRVDTFDLFDIDVDGEVERITAEIDNTDLFPGLNLVWAVAPEQNLRFGVSQTVNRPEFRELAPFEFTDIVGGRAGAGNPDLKHALIQNYDVRWEWFPRAEEVVAASFFYKNLDRPIERVVEPTAQLRTSYRNAESARNAGLELEARKRFGAHFLAGLNYTFVDSQVQLGADDTVVLTSLQRPLAGTSRHLFNGIVETRVGRTTARLLVNYYDDRIADVGSLGLPDIIEQGRPAVDLVLSHRLGPFNVRFAAENLSNREIRYKQGGEPQRAFTIGRTFLLQVAYVTF